jgi:hypothetical protein
MLLVLVLVGIYSRADALVLCTPKSGEGEVRVRTACTKNETQLDPATLGLQVAQCSPDSVEVGPLCVDKYEASMWRTSDASVIEKIRAGTVTEADLIAAGAQSCFDTNCTDSFFAVSIPGVRPERGISWFQAQQACANAGKQLLTNAEWQMAAEGTPDPGTDNGSTDCNITSIPSEPDPVETGSRSNCVSVWGTLDMVGNLWEWVADWVPKSTACPGWSTLSDDLNCLAGASTTQGPTALFRGGSFNDVQGAGVFAIGADHLPFQGDSTIGFRCGRPK